MYYRIELTLLIGNFKGWEGYVSEGRIARVEGKLKKIFTTTDTVGNAGRFSFKSARRVVNKCFPIKKGWQAVIVPVNQTP